MSDICCREWMAPRADVPTSVPVKHVCVKAWEHRYDDDARCVCSCGAIEDQPTNKENQ